MSRKKLADRISDRSKIQQSSERIESHISNALTTLKHLSKIYDDGYHAIAFTMSTEVIKLLTDNAIAARTRGNLRFISPKSTPLSLVARNILIAAKIQKNHIDFVPHIDAHGSIDAYVTLRFVDWWNREKIYIASCAKRDVPLGMIPLYAEDQLKEQERESLTRREFITLVRNSIGSHLDNELPALLDDLHKAESFGISFASGVLPFGVSLPLGTSPIAAMVREIVFEIIHAFETGSIQTNELALSARQT